jgi:hypothetical protein
MTLLSTYPDIYVISGKKKVSKNVINIAIFLLIYVILCTLVMNFKFQNDSLRIGGEVSKIIYL